MCSQCDQPLKDIPDKARYTVAELIPRFAQLLDITEVAARGRLYRAIESGEISARRYLGALRIPRCEVEKIFTGEPLI